MTLIVSTFVSMWISSFQNMRFPSLGTIQVVGVEVYGGNISTTQNGAQCIDWGTVYPGSVINCSFYVKSKSNMPVTLNLSISNINFKNSKGENITQAPPINEPLSLKWNYTDTVLNPKDAIYVTLTLKASSDNLFVEYLIDNAVKEFSFDIIITALPQILSHYKS
ncbi:MAG: hypothetical protein ACPLRY_07185 [Candidatus Bathyarchaeales archaeon]